MDKDATLKPDSFEIKRVFKAPIGNVWDAFTKKEGLKKWCAKAPATVGQVHVDLVPGGEYLIEMKDSNGKVYAVSGSYQTIHEPHELVFTWAFLDNPTDVTRIKVRLKEENNFTQVLFRQEGFKHEFMRDQLLLFWSSCLQKLETYFQ